LAFGRNLIGYEEKWKERQVIVETQLGLQKLGYQVGKIDGKLGPKTAGAIKQFQKDQSIKVDGKPSEALLQRIENAIGGRP
jgi:peptidoglycan hydrolase-like protein with peptidoglycan-binding domain